LKSTTFTQRLAIALIVSLGIAFFSATYRAIDNIVAEQSRVQQQSVSPVFDLVRDELLRPFYIAETFASSVEVSAIATSPGFDEDVLLRRLQKMESDLGLTFFVASERARKQYLSDGRTLDLIEGKVAWYYEAIESNKDVMADLGKVGDVHLYFDVRIDSAEGDFLGYVGVGKRVSRFLESFEEHKAAHGHDFLFVNDDNEIILTSLPDLVVTDAYVPRLDDIAWFDGVGSLDRSFDSEIVELDDADFLVTEYAIQQLGWRLLLLMPLEARQAQVTQTFFSNAFAAVFIILVLVGVSFSVMLVYKRNLERRTQLDLLTGLPNRTFVQQRFEQLHRSGQTVCVIVIDLDHFKDINDTYGHATGDRVLKAAAAVFKSELRDESVISRWGGEEFVMLIPSATIDEGRAVSERARRELEKVSIPTRETSVSVTASFGVAFGSAAEDSLADMLARADRAMYDAKQGGRNQVMLATAPQT